MNTTTIEKLYNLTHHDKLAVLEKAANILKNDGLVAFPTETVYGLGANALSETAVKKIFLAKGRPSDNPLIVHISKKEQIYTIAKDIPNNAEILINKFWPAPLTIILKKKDIIPHITSGGLNTVAIRMPKNELTCELIEKCGFPLAGPSANTSTKPSPTEADHVFSDLSGKIDMILDDGKCEVGLESTVVEVLDNYVTILRAGSITKDMLMRVIPDVRTIENSTKSPGNKYKHYSPKGQVILIDGDDDIVNDYLIKSLQKDKINNVKSIVLAKEQYIKSFNGFNTLNIGNTLDTNSIARNLFSTLRECDKLNMKKIYIQTIEEIGVGVAIMNRLRKASAGNIIYL